MEGEEVTAITKTNTLRDYLKILFRHKLVIITTYITIMTAVFVSIELKTPYYEAMTTMLVTAAKKVASPYYRSLVPRATELSKTQSAIILSNPVIERTVRALGLDKRPVDYAQQFNSPLKAALMAPKYERFKAKLEAMEPEEREELLFRNAVQSLKGSIATSTLLQTDLLTITARDFDPEEAARIANAVSRAYVIFDLEMQLAEFQVRFGEKHSSSVQLRDYINTMKERLSGELLLNEVEAIGPGSVKVIEQAIAPESPSAANQKAALVLAFGLSGVVGVLLAFGFDRLEQTFRSPQDVEKYLDIPFLGSIPKKKPKEELLITKPTPSPTRYALSFQDLSAQVDLLMKDKNLKSVLVTNAEEPGETAAVIANLGICSSRNAGHKTLIIDANLRAPSVSGIFDILDKPGLTDVIEGKVSFEDAVRHMGDNLYVLPSNNTALNPVTLVGSSMMTDLIKRAEEKYERTFIACADIRRYTDAVILSSVAGGTILIINEGKVKRQVVMTAIAPLLHKKAALLGAVLNNRIYEIPDVIYKMT